MSGCRFVKSLESSWEWDDVKPAPVCMPIEQSGRLAIAAFVEAGPRSTVSAVLEAAHRRTASGAWYRTRCTC